MTQGRAFHVDQLNGTSLKWGQDGELSRLDHERILQLLCQSDPVAESLMEAVDQPATVYAGNAGSSDRAAFV
jgi:hypothetical protein